MDTTDSARGNAPLRCIILAGVKGRAGVASNSLSNDSKVNEVVMMS